MAFTEENFRKVKILSKQVEKLIGEVELERSLFRKDYGYEPASRKTGELRRRSMDLTRALADLRRS